MTILHLSYTKDNQNMNNQYNSSYLNVCVFRNKNKQREYIYYYIVWVICHSLSQNIIYQAWAWI